MNRPAMEATKTPKDENFPVASLVLSPDRREAVLAFAFVRAADDIAERVRLADDYDLQLTTADKLHLLTRAMRPA